MSIIHDALKKVQEKNAKQAHPPTPQSVTAPVAETQPSAATKPDQHNPITIVLLSMISIVVIIIFAIIWNLAKGTTEHITIAASQVPATKIGQPSAPAPVLQAAVKQPAETKTESVPAPAPAQVKADPNDPLSSVHVEGIMDMGGGKKVALMNGNIYEEGQTIYGRIIAEIRLEGVTIMDNGNKRTFPVNPPKP